MKLPDGELIFLAFLKFLLKINVFIGRKIMYLIAKYEAEGEVQEVVKSQKFDMRGMSDRLKNVMLHDQDIIDKRWDICKGCEFLNNDKCDKSGCYMRIKTASITLLLESTMIALWLTPWLYLGMR